MKKHSIVAGMGAVWLVLWVWKYGSYNVTDSVVLKVQSIQRWKQISWITIPSRPSDLVTLFLVNHSWLAPVIEKSSWWNRYQEWSLDSESVILHLDSLKRLEKFRIDYPDLYEKLSRHPLWWEAWMYDENSPEQDEALIENVMSRLEYLDNNPQVMNILRQLWYEKDQLFSASWQDKESIYTVLSDLTEIAARTNSVELDLFFQSELWKPFLDWTTHVSQLTEAFEIFMKATKSSV